MGHTCGQSTVQHNYFPFNLQESRDYYCFANFIFFSLLVHTVLDQGIIFFSFFLFFYRMYNSSENICNLGSISGLIYREK